LAAIHVTIEEFDLLPKRRYPVLLALAALAGALVISAVAVATARTSHHRADGYGQGSDNHGYHGGGYEAHRPPTPIRHVVVIYGENISFDHYFGTYPKAANTGGGQPFTAAPGTPAVNGLPATNPNLSPPQRLDSSATGSTAGPGNGQLTCDQDHNYSDEQKAFDNGKMDKFVESVGTASGTAPGQPKVPCQAKQVMDYYDGNTVTGLWNYAQHYAMSDNSFQTTFGPSSPGALNLVSGDTGNVDMTHTANKPSIATSTSPNADLTADGQGGYSVTSDPQPYYDDCSTRDAVALNGANIGDQLNKAGVSWGWFEGGFRPTTSFQDAATATHRPGQSTSQFIPDEFKAGGFNGSVPHSSNQGICNAVSPVGQALGGTGQYGYKDDYIPHHEPFQYYPSTANPHHLTVASSNGQDTLAGLSSIGHDTQSYSGAQPQFNTPNHNYDTGDFDQLVSAITAGQLPPSALPAVSFLKAPGNQDGHAGYSDPADEQAFVVKEINALMKSPDWNSTAVFINYDDSDGWYDHAYSGVTNPSTSPADNLTNTRLSGATSGLCTGPGATASTPLAGEQGRCGFGPRLPMLVISPYARHNYVDHNLSDQASIINFVEYNWGVPGIPGSADQVLAGRTAAYRGAAYDGRRAADRGAGQGDQGQGNPAAFDLAGMFKFSGESEGHNGSALVLDPSTGQPAAGPTSHRRMVRRPRSSRRHHRG